MVVVHATARLARSLTLNPQAARRACARLSLEPPRFNAGQVTTLLLAGSLAGAASGGPAGRRRYTLTHNDLTGSLLLSVGHEWNAAQTSGWRAPYLPCRVCARG